MLSKKVRARKEMLDTIILGNPVVWLPIFSFKQERERHNAEDKTKEFTSLRSALRHAGFSGKRMKMM